MGTADYGYRVCSSCHGEFHEDDIRKDGRCWLCHGDEEEEE